MGTSHRDGEPLALADIDVSSLVPISDAIDVLEGAYLELSRDRAGVMPRAHMALPNGLMHSVGGYLNRDGEGYAGCKVWAIVGGRAQPVLLLFSAVDGSLVGAVEAAKLGQIRTAATTGLGTKLLAREDAKVLACLGTGRQALPQIEAVAAVRELREVRIWGRDRSRSEDFGALVAEKTGLIVEIGTGPAEAVRGADVVVTVTRTREPLLGVAEIEPGVHVNAVGALTAAASELTPAAVASFDAMVVDSLPQARSDCGEIRDAVAAGEVQWSEVVELAALVAGAVRGRAEPGDRTLLRAMGIGLADVAVGVEALRRASDRGEGSRFRFQHDDNQAADTAVGTAKGER